MGLATALVLSMGVLALMVKPAEAARCVCPKVYAPVECDRGKVYPNQCVADCRHAKNCVPIGL
jgi:hypothetical protein